MQMNKTRFLPSRDNGDRERNKNEKKNISHVPANKCSESTEEGASPGSGIPGRLLGGKLRPKVKIRSIYSCSRGGWGQCSARRVGKVLDVSATGREREWGVMKLRMQVMPCQLPGGSPGPG